MDSQPSGKGQENWFTGAVRIDTLYGAIEARRSAALNLTVEPSVKAAWYTLSFCQKLVVISRL